MPSNFTRAQRSTASLPVTPTPATSTGDETCNTPVYDKNLTDAERAKLRADRAAAA